MRRIYSLLGSYNFPVFSLGNLARKALILAKVRKRSCTIRLKYPVFFPVTRESGFRDGFAYDSLLQRGVRREPVA
jgi:hypothetical protein